MLGSTSLRRNRFRYTRYQDGSEELFDGGNDPRARKNLIADSKFTSVLDDMRTQHDAMRKTWLGSVPKCRVTLSKGKVVQIC
jgi:hypothetical protein